MRWRGERLGQAAGGGDGVPGDPGGGVRDQEGGDGCDAGQVFLFVEAVDHVRGCQAGGEGVDADAARPQFRGERDSHGFNRRLRCGMCFIRSGRRRSAVGLRVRNGMVGAQALPSLPTDGLFYLMWEMG